LANCPSIALIDAVVAFVPLTARAGIESPPFFRFSAKT